ncbi:hypothetical protein [Pseudaestuariivita rosea]|uniref:hypothetical protein n=1 Tax=Pseudaestuariivita rosea TaxID=2763263 RepID=UPI001ABA9D45|nr:hypothetical protein [Pseudaestuariivita rosea]
MAQAEYTHNALGQKVVRHLTQENRVIYAAHYVDGNRIAEYEWDAVAQTSTLLREYIWMNGMVVAEGGAVYFCSNGPHRLAGLCDRHERSDGLGGAPFCRR